MKLHTITVASLLGAGLLITSGCTKDDLEKEIEKIAKVNMVYVINTLDTDIIVHVTGMKDTLTVKPSQVALVPLTGEEANKVYYKTGSYTSKTANYQYGSAYAFVSTKCNGTGYIQDSTSGKGIIKIVNATNTDVIQGTSIIITDAHGSHVEFTNAATRCSVTDSGLSSSKLNIKKGDEVKIDINGHENTVKSPIDAPNGIDIDIILMDNNKTALAPLATYDDALKQK